MGELLITSGLASDGVMVEVTQTGNPQVKLKRLKPELQMRSTQPILQLRMKPQ